MSKQIFLIGIIIFIMTLPVFSQVSGGFYFYNDYYGNSYKYFKGTNVTNEIQYINIIAVNFQKGGISYWSMFLEPNHYFVIGPKEGWIWEPMEKLIVKYSDGRSNEWSNSSSTSSISFTGNTSYRKYKCDGKCLCTAYKRKGTFDSDCANCGHRKERHYEFK